MQNFKAEDVVLIDNIQFTLDQVNAVRETLKQIEEEYELPVALLYMKDKDNLYVETFGLTDEEDAIFCKWFNEATKQMNLGRRIF